MKITVQDPPEVVIGNGPFAFRRPYYHGGLVAVKVTAPCPYCGNPVTFIRGGVFSGNSYHWECYTESGDNAKEYEAFKKSVLGDMTPEEYQRIHGVAWNE
jgi:hypothetical protein